MGLINDKDLKKVISKCKKAVKENKGKEGNTFLCSGSVSDMLANLYIMKELGGGDLYIRTTTKVFDTEPFKEMHEIISKPNLFLDYMAIPADTYSFWKPLLEMQPYINSVNTYNGEDVTFDLDLYRCCYFNDAMLDKTQGIRMKAFAETWGIKLTFAQPWITVNELKDPDRKVLVSRSLKIQGGDLMYRTLAPFLYENAFFYGTDQEYIWFGNSSNAMLWRMRVTNAAELASMVGAMDLLFVNDNPVYWLALAMGVKTVTHELCPDYYNCICDSPNVRYFLGNTPVVPDIDFSSIQKKSRKKKDVQKD